MKIFNVKLYGFILVLLCLGDCSVSASIGVWREFYWSAIEHVQYIKWIVDIIIFSSIALAGCFISGYGNYIISLISLDMRTKLTKKALKLNNYGNIEGGNQRIQEDCKYYPQLMMNLGYGILRSIILILSFGTIIVYQVNGYYLLIPIFYTIIGTWIASKIAFPLLNLNYMNQVWEAKFRQILSKTLFKVVHRNNFNLYRQTKYLQYFQQFYMQIVTILPHIIMSVVYFTGKVTFGVFMQVAGSLNELTTNFSFLVTSFDDINKWLSCRKRLKELYII